ncbi:unnamed protein product [Brachionus calyciflorus]|uniref:DUF1279 domain-containing protein n=1 Tax=Brachionus calyciflorus TaxID=104777 RepID=A0A814EPS0_9BILA|nr:unnamed protein product [Brachionus calyciflorus]
MNRLTFLRSPLLLHNLKNKTNSNLKNFFSIQNKSLIKSNRLIQFELLPFRSNSTNSQIPAQTVINQTGSLSIFKRFKEAYKQHGKILLWCHFISCWGWVIGFFFLAKGGFDISSLFNLLEKIHIMSRETIDSINNKINTFNLEEFLRKSFFHHILPDSWIKKLGESITGQTLKYVITAIMLYKIVTPLRYVFTLAVTNVVIKLFKRQGKIPMQPPPGSSIKELYTEQKQVIRRSLKAQKEKFKYKRNLLRAKQLKAKNTLFSQSNKTKTL